MKCSICQQEGHRCDNQKFHPKAPQLVIEEAPVVFEEKVNEETKLANDVIVSPHIQEREDSFQIKSKKYKTIGELKNAGLQSMILTTSKMESCIERDYLDKWLYDNHYRKKEMIGNLTMRIKNLNNEICYREIMKRCFDNVDILSNKVSKSILTKQTIEFISELHIISPSMTGTFIDYLIRRIISELMGILFFDCRSESIHRHEHLCAKPVINYAEKTVLELKKICKDILIIDNTGKFIKLSQTNKKTMTDFLLKKQESDKCKMIIDCDGNKCVLPRCQFHCYQKAQNTKDFKTADLIPEIFHISLFHSEAFGQAPKQEQFDKFNEKLLLTTDIHDVLIKPLTELCKDIIKDKSSINLNPVLGGELDEIKYSIPSDADLVTDDILIDIKCTKKDHSIYEISQLLGYSSLMMLNKAYRKKINKISILNLLLGSVSTFDVEFITKDHCVKFIKELTSIR